jgi:hypothetical protein
VYPRMSEAEIHLFTSFLGCSSRYLEFGSGGSTCLAAGLVRTSVVSVDSSGSWLERVAKYCSDKKLPIAPALNYVDIGPTGDWGYPTDASTRDNWPKYHTHIWTNPIAVKTDLYFIDGRFRVACFMQAVLHAEPDAVIIFHDFQSREQYHVVHEVAREIATSEDLSVFVPKGRIRGRAQELLSAYEFTCL